MWLLLAFVAVPMIAIALFIQVGGVIGLMPTLAIVLITAVAGTYLLRSQGLATLAKLQNSMQGAGDPTEHLVHGAMIVFAGALLLTPGFFTDAVGLSLMVPNVRMMLFGVLRKRMVVMAAAQQAQLGEMQEQGPTIIDGEFEDITPQERTNPSPSGGTKH